MFYSGETPTLVTWKLGGISKSLYFKNQHVALCVQLYG